MHGRLVAAVAGLVLAATGARSDAGPGRPKKPVAVEDTRGTPPPAVTDSRMIVGILDVRVAGLPASAGDMFERQLEALATDAGRDRFWIGTRQRMKEMLAGSTQWIDGCLLGPCMMVLREQTRAAVVMTVFLQRLGTTYRYVITLIRTDTGAVVDQRTEACGACTQDEAVTAATIAALDSLISVPDKVVDIALADPKAVTLRVEAPYKQRLRKAKRKTRTTALILTGLAAGIGGLGGYWLATDNDDMARPALGAAAGLATAGALTYAVSLTWD